MKALVGLAPTSPTDLRAVSFLPTNTTMLKTDIDQSIELPVLALKPAFHQFHSDANFFLESISVFKHVGE
jgi:hypothetical protein